MVSFWPLTPASYLTIDAVKLRAERYCFPEITLGICKRGCMGWRRTQTRTDAQQFIDPARRTALAAASPLLTAPRSNVLTCFRCAPGLRDVWQDVRWTQATPPEPGRTPSSSTLTASATRPGGVGSSGLAEVPARAAWLYEQLVQRLQAGGSHPKQLR
jgi:hypothetical protein